MFTFHSVSETELHVSVVLDGHLIHQRHEHLRLKACAFLLFFLGHGGRKNYFNYQKGYIPRMEAVAEIVYIAVAVAGICAGGIIAVGYLFNAIQFIII